MTDYTDNVAAFALFFKNGHNKALRVEVPGLALEFTDGLYIGRDPEGILYYNDAEDLKKTGNHYYDVTQTDGGASCSIEFRFSSKTAKPYAKFIAKDTSNAVSIWDANDRSGKGSWVALSVGSCAATVTKTSSDSKITINAKPVSKVGTWTAPAKVLEDTGFKIEGTLYYRELANISKGKYANYNDDRIIFYEDDYTGKDFAAFFIPLKSNVTTLQARPAKTITFENITWADK